MNKIIEKAEAWLNDPDGMDDLNKPYEIVKMLIAEVSRLEAELSRPMSAQERSKLEAQKQEEIANMKKSHAWVASREFVDAARTRMAPFTSHCGACGLPIFQFKAKPQPCPKAKK